MNRTVRIALSGIAVAAAPGAGVAKPVVKHKPPVVKARTIVGPFVQMEWGPVRATIVVKGKRITDVRVTSPHGKEESDQINSQAEPLLRQETLKAQSARINLLSEATLTSEAFAKSLQAALTQAGLK